MKKYFVMLLAVLTACTSLTSCLSTDDDDVNKVTVMGYFTITGNLSQGYILYNDAGGMAVPTTTSVTSLTGTNGFGNHHRALLYLQYTNDMVSSDGTTITGCEVADGSYMAENKPVTLEDAEAAKINDTDSIFTPYSVENPWAYRGYLNVVVSGYYSYVNGFYLTPTCNLVYDPASIEENAITFDLCFNQHSEKSVTMAGPAYIYTSFLIEDMDELVPGSGDIMVTIRYDNEEKTLNVSRKNCYRGNYE